MRIASTHPGASFTLIRCQPQLASNITTSNKDQYRRNSFELEAELNRYRAGISDRSGGSNPRLSTMEDVVFLCGNREIPGRTQHERIINAPPPLLPASRPRTLTPPPSRSSEQPSDASSSPLQQVTLPQSKSALFSRLSPEIRQLIWDILVGGNCFHIARLPRRLLAIKCAEDIGPPGATASHNCWGLKTDYECTTHYAGLYLYPFNNHPARPANLASVLQVCRRMYAETLPILYGNNTFDINHLDTLFYLEQSILPSRMEQIRFLNLEWRFTRNGVSNPVPYDLGTWVAACSTLKSLTGLQHLVVHIGGDALSFKGCPRDHHWESILDPLAEIKVSNQFEVLMGWTAGECAEAVRRRKYPFRLTPMIDAPRPWVWGS